MQNLTPEAHRAVTEIAERNGVGLDAALTLLTALSQGNGAQAQFHHPDLGGMGQWSQGGMIMIGDMFNQGLKHRVDRLCNELSALIRSQPAFTSSPKGEGVSLFVAGSGAGDWWPADLGNPASVGSQNDLRYAYFPDSRRLAIQRDGELRIYDSGDHRISGVSQQQSGDQSLTFTSQLGRVRIDDLAAISPEPAVAASPVEPTPTSSPPLTHRALGPEPGASSGGDSVVALIERLADLRQKNILTEEEFIAKKRELLSRL